MDVSTNGHVDLTPTNDWLTLNREQRFERAGAFVLNLLTRTDLVKALLGDERRNMFRACHIPEPGAVSPEQYYTLYDRSIGGRVVEVLSKESWQVTPWVYEEKDGDTATEFEVAWDTVTRDLFASGLPDGKNYYQDEAGNPVWEVLSRADVLSGVGRYGVIVFGLGDAAEDMSKPVVRKKGMKLLAVDAYTEAEATIAAFNTEQNSPRYRLPELYQMKVSDSPWYGGAAPPLNNQHVHWSRVLHVADTQHHARSSRVYAAPRQEPVLNEIYGVLKLALCAPEMFWKGAFMGLAIKTQPQTAGDVPINKEKLKQMMSDFENDLQRWIGLVGMDAQSLAPQVSDPTPFIDKLIELICIKLGIPVRIFKGSERGELASSQDDQAWNDRLKARQYNYITPNIVIPFVNRLIWYGVLPTPKGFSVEWPDLTSKSDQEKATVAKTRLDALKVYAPDPSAIVTPFDMLTEFMGIEEAKAQAMIDNAEELLAEKAQEDAKKAAEAHSQAMDQTEEMIARGLAPDPTKANKPPKPPPGTPAAAAANPANPFVRNEEGEPTDNYNPAQKRDAQGEWTKGGGVGLKDKEKKIDLGDARHAASDHSIAVDHGRHGRERFDKVLGATFGSKDVDLSKVAAASNAAPGAKVRVSLSEGGGQIHVFSDNGDGNHARRTFYRDADNKLVVHNDIFVNNHGSGPKAKGADLLHDQVKALRGLGVDRIETTAARDDNRTTTKGGREVPDPFVGYKVWPRLGYDGNMSDKTFAALPKEARDALGEKPGRLFGIGKRKGSRLVSDLYGLPGGRELWEKHGDTTHMVFDVAEGSASSRKLAGYLKNRKGAI